VKSAFFLLGLINMDDSDRNEILYYVHDPMCSWCWAFDAVLKRLIEKLPAHLSLIRILGGLAADTDEPMPEAMQKNIQDTWGRIEQHVKGIKFNYGFWSANRPRRSTYPACRAVIAARQQAGEYDKAMTMAIQQAYYKEAQNPSDVKVLIKLARELGLQPGQFTDSLNSEQVQQELLNEIAFSQQLSATSFPSLVLKSGDRLLHLPIDYNNEDVMLTVIIKFMARQK